FLPFCVCSREGSTLLPQFVFRTPFSNCNHRVQLCPFYMCPLTTPISVASGSIRPGCDHRYRRKSSERHVLRITLLWNSPALQIHPIFFDGLYPFTYLLGSPQGTASLPTLPTFLPTRYCRKGSICLQ